jgi:hypothetical protein
MTSKPLTIGLDCGEHTGLAIYDSINKKIIKFQTTDFFGAIRLVREYEKEKVKVIVEVPSDFVYARNEFQKGKVRDRMLINIGMNRRESQLMARALKICGYDVAEVLPVRAHKWTAEQLKRYLGIDARTSQHVRDACRLAFFHAGTRF